MRKSASVLMPSVERNQTLPPSPPSPPSGPPKGTNFSRRKLTQPRPPLPACTLSLASSTNFIGALRGILRTSGRTEAAHLVVHLSGATNKKGGRLPYPLHGF